MSKNKKQTREAFRSAVFERDGHRCLFCLETKNLDAHHIVSRKLFPDGGYFLDNGATLCQKHHLQAEQGFLTKEQIYASVVQRIGQRSSKAFMGVRFSPEAPT